jgi:hypothetical protein
MARVERTFAIIKVSRTPDAALVAQESLNGDDGEIDPDALVVFAFGGILLVFGLALILLLARSPTLCRIDLI